MNKEYVWSLNDEEYGRFSCDTIKEAIEEAVDNYICDNEITEDKITIQVFIGKPEYYQYNIDAEKILDEMQEEAQNNCTFDIDCLTLTKKQILSLQKMLDQVIEKFFTKENIPSPFYTVNNIDIYDVHINRISEDDFEIVSFEKIIK